MRTRIMQNAGVIVCHCFRCAKPIRYGDSAWELLSSAVFCSEECALAQWAEMKMAARTYLSTDEQHKAFDSPPFTIRAAAFSSPAV